MFWTRLISGIILVIIALATMSIGGSILAITLLLLSLIAFREVTKALLVNKEAKRVNKEAKRVNA